ATFLGGGVAQCSSCLVLAVEKPIAMRYSEPKTRAAYAECRRLATHHYENFPVASWLVPPDKRDALAVIYAFARRADDFADDPGISGRLAALAEWRSKLDGCFGGAADHPVFIALRDVAGTFRLSRDPFQNLICAFESDVRRSEEHTSELQSR